MSHRFIHNDYIAGIMQEELANQGDEVGYYCSAELISSITGMSYNLAKFVHAADNYALLGQEVLNTENGIQQLQEALTEYDGYGQFFNHCNGNEIEYKNYLVFEQ